MDKLGKYIAIEGLDGSGKSTLFDNLVDSLKKQGFIFSTIRPTQLIDSNSILEYLFRKSQILSKNSFFRAIVYAIRSYKASKKVNWKADLIIGDRSLITSYVTRWRRWLNSSLLTILFVNILEPFIKPPDYVIFLVAPPNLLQQRLSDRGFIDIDETPTRSAMMRNAYEEIKTKFLIRRLKNTVWIEIDADKAPDILTQEAMGIIKKIINPDN